MRTCTRSSLLLTLAGIAGCGAISIEANATPQSGPQSEALNNTLVKHTELEIQLDLTLYKLTDENGAFIGYRFSGTGSVMAEPPTAFTADLEYSFTSRNETLTVEDLGGGMYWMKSVSGKQWLLRKDPCENLSDDCYAVIDPDVAKVVVKVAAPGGWHLSRGETPSLSEMMYLLVMHTDPMPAGPHVPCNNPTLQGCISAARDTCRDFCAQVSYSCNSQTGTVSCSWKCVNCNP